MALTGDTQALRGFEARLKKFSSVSQYIARALAPKVAGLIDQGFTEQRSPLGVAWPATKSGEPAFGGGTSEGRVLSRLVGKSSIRTTVLYPLHFHQDGTHVVGRKRGRAIASRITGGYTRAVLAQHGLGGGAPRKRKGESDEAFAHRTARFEAAKTIRKEARIAARKHASAAIAEARTAGGWHDPPRPMIPDEGDAIPPTWVTTITETARPILASVGAV